MNVSTDTDQQPGWGAAPARPRCARLRRRSRVEGLEHHVGDALAGEHVASDDGGERARPQQAAFGDAHAYRRQAALVERDLRRHHAAKRVDDRRVRHRRRRVGVAEHLRARAWERSAEQKGFRV
jgi:hypothetical protein